ncbi:MAG: AmmeMemoRadiSam system radical SAM enzyme [Chloroflexota bacterium]
MLKESLLQEPLTADRVRCHVCQWRCTISSGAWGHCQTRQNRDGKLFSTIYGVVSSAAADPIEKKPVFHYKPGSSVFSLGSLGCNFRCLFCQNWEIAYAEGGDADDERYDLQPERAVELALQYGCKGLAWTYNEPAIWLEYILDTARLAKAAGLYTVLVTNGYATEESLDLMAPYLDVYRVDVKRYGPRLYRELIKAPGSEGVRAVAKRARENWALHIEVVTNIVPGYNDGDEELASLAAWIAADLGPTTPWHVTRFFPHAQLIDVPATPVESLRRAVAIGHEQGLPFVYLGNVATSDGQNTYCPSGGEMLVARQGYRTRVMGVRPDGTCSAHGTPLNLVP